MQDSHEPLLPLSQDFFVDFPAPAGIHRRVCWPRLGSQETRAQEFDAERKTRAVAYCPWLTGVDADCRGAIVEENIVLFFDRTQLQRLTAFPLCLSMSRRLLIGLAR